MFNEALYFLTWARENKEKVALKNKKWKEKNRDKLNSYFHKRRALDIGAEGNFTDVDIKRIFHDQFGKCQGCNREFSETLKYTIDHIIPLSKNGTNWPINIQLLCGSCNYSKGPKLMDEWLEFKAKT